MSGFRGGGPNGPRFATTPGVARFAGVPGGGARFAGLRTAGFRHGGFGHHHRHHRHFRNFAAVGFGFGVPYYYNNYNYYDDYCYQVRRVPTPYGWRWRQMYVCG